MEIIRKKLQKLKKLKESAEISTPRKRVITKEQYAASTPISEEKWNELKSWERKIILCGRGRTLSYLEYLAFRELRLEEMSAE